MWFDLFILAPVLAFLLWLFWYSAPPGRDGWQARIDLAIAVFGLIGALLVLFGLHLTLDPAIEGLSRNVIAVASSYLFLLLVLGAGWIRRFCRTGPAAGLAGSPGCSVSSIAPAGAGHAETGERTPP